jgi:hypothetical protein
MHTQVWSLVMVLAEMESGASLCEPDLKALQMGAVLIVLFCDCIYKLNVCTNFMTIYKAPSV